jgi:N-acetylglucosaminyldiphosphoundecaprenol N-acetyl-beta-D-mannosaminyltransferase
MDTMISERIELLGLEFDDMDVDTVVAQLLARPPDAPFGYVVTPNADHFARLRRIPNLAVVYQAAMLCLLDSQLIGHVARLLRLARPRVVTGAALTTKLLERLDGQRVAVIGLRRAEMVFLRIRYPAIEFIHHSPPMGLLQDPVAFRRARDFGAAAGTQFIFIALGSPVQELLAYAIVARRSATGIGLCIGAALQFRAGFVRRAPVWMQRAGLEWLHRFAQEPGRLATRYLWYDPRVLFALANAAWRPRRRK